MIEEHLEKSFLVFYLNSFSSEVLSSFLWPLFEKEGPTYIPIEDMTDILISGLKQEKINKKFYDEVIKLLKTVLELLRSLLGSSSGSIDPSTAFYIISIVELFEKIYEKRCEKYLKNHKISIDILLSSHVKEIAHCREITSEFER